jgi:hypothetical protein
MSDAMAVPAHFFGPLPCWVKAHPAVIKNPTKGKILELLSGHAPGDKTDCFPSYRRIADAIERTRGHVRRLVRELIQEDGLLARERAKNATGRVFRLLWKVARAAAQGVAPVRGAPDVRGARAGQVRGAQARLPVRGAQARPEFSNEKSQENAGGSGVGKVPTPPAASEDGDAGAGTGRAPESGTGGVPAARPETGLSPKQLWERIKAQADRPAAPRAEGPQTPSEPLPERRRPEVDPEQSRRNREFLERLARQQGGKPTAGPVTAPAPAAPEVAPPRKGPRPIAQAIGTALSSVFARHQPKKDRPPGLGLTARPGGRSEHRTPPG